MDLTPTTAAPVRRRSRFAYVVLGLVVLALGVVVYQALSSASLYFYNADEAVQKQDELGDKRFRLQGTVLGDTIAERADGVTFSVAFNGVRVEARHDGDPPELFEPGIPVVLEGRWDAAGDWFDSDRILVKHTASYEADNGDRIRDAEDGEGGDGSAATTTRP